MQQQQQKSLDLTPTEYYSIKQFIRNIKYELKEIHADLVRIVYPNDEKSNRVFKELGF